VIIIDIDYLIDQLESLRDRGIQVPLTKMVMIDEEQFLRLINQLRISVPREIQEARQLQQERDRVIAQAQQQAHHLVALAEQRAEEIVGEHGIANRAEEREQVILKQAHREAANIRAEADAYALRVLVELEEQLQKFQNTVSNGISLLEQGRKAFDFTPPEVEEIDGAEELEPEADEEMEDLLETPAEEPKY
jgi:cell division septum initiation protein DivIVA